MSDIIKTLRGLLAKATPGPWLVWTETVSTKADAVRELTEQVELTPEFGGVLPMLSTTDGRCPATTGCGKDSVANAELISGLVSAAPMLLAELEEYRHMGTAPTVYTLVKERDAALTRVTELAGELATLRETLTDARMWVSTARETILGYDENDIDGESADALTFIAEIDRVLAATGPKVPT